MKLEARIARLESKTSSPESSAFLILRPICEREGGIKRIRVGDRTWLRLDAETEAEFEARVRAEATPKPDYGDDE